MPSENTSACYQKYLLFTVLCLIQRICEPKFQRQKNGISYNNGLRNAIIGNFNAWALRQNVGVLWKSYLIGERIKQNQFLGLDKEFYSWRIYGGKEIDLIEIIRNNINVVEFKWGNKHPKVLIAFANTNGSL
jgi:hypothetical protein